jgi:hypothetical protein
MAAVILTPLLLAALRLCTMGYVCAVCGGLPPPPWTRFGGLSISAELGHGGMMRRGDAFTLLVEIIIMVIVVLVVLSIAGVIH